ncbi:hypothetical protein [Tumebacillus flagellatus]|uniref:Uncharacterized protein n=1 Tax=Tumebacillus flagellatus TaxID=1157490 RepID=A0A074MBL5_9BACL|nr:hypothetical protein [Tumebacillus flagellatus]KEO83317.1 hypothetical protein EL26_10085 [Tumebacillus flagellatus]
MKTSRWFAGTLVGLVLIIGTYWATKTAFENRHHQEYSTHISNALTDVKMADQGIRDLQPRWGELSQLEISNALLQVASSLKAAEVEADGLQGYLMYHDDTNFGPSPSFLSDLFMNYREAVESRLRETWNLNKEDAKWSVLQQDISTMEKDLHHLAEADPSKMQNAKLSELRQYWSSYTADLKFQEVKKRYDEKHP